MAAAVLPSGGAGSLGGLRVCVAEEGGWRELRAPSGAGLSPERSAAARFRGGALLISATELGLSAFVLDGGEGPPARLFVRGDDRGFRSVRWVSLAAEGDERGGEQGAERSGVAHLLVCEEEGAADYYTLTIRGEECESRRFQACPLGGQRASEVGDFRAQVVASGRVRSVGGPQLGSVLALAYPRGASGEISLQCFSRDTHMWTREARLGEVSAGRAPFAFAELFHRYVVLGRAGDWFMYDRKAMRGSRLEGRLLELRGAGGVLACAVCRAEGGLLLSALCEDGEISLALSLEEVAAALSDAGLKSRFLASLALRGLGGDGEGAEDTHGVGGGCVGSAGSAESAGPAESAGSPGAQRLGNTGKHALPAQPLHASKESPGTPTSPLSGATRTTVVAEEIRESLLQA